MKKLSFFILTAILTISVFLMKDIGSLYHVQTAVEVPEQERVPAATLNPDSCVDLVEYFFENSGYTASAADLKKAKAIAKSYGVPDSKLRNVKTYDGIINEVYMKIVGSGGDRSIQKSNKIAEFGKKLREIYAGAGLSKTELRDIDYFLAKHVMMAEAFVPSAFKQVADNEFKLGQNTTFTHVNYKQYKEYVLSYINRTAPYTNIARDGVIDRKDIREMEALNLFPVYFGHDMTHVRYALFHERYFQMIFGSARSLNHKRYVLIGALGEGCDRVQYSEERAISRYFSQKGMDLEEAMVYLGKATEEELDEVMDGSESRSTFQGLIDMYREWKPKTSPSYPTTGSTGAGLDVELDDMVLYLRKLQKDAEVKPHFEQRDSAILY